jgi:hypothetical protein
VNLKDVRPFHHAWAIQHEKETEIAGESQEETRQSSHFAGQARVQMRFEVILVALT